MITYLCRIDGGSSSSIDDGGSSSSTDDGESSSSRRLVCVKGLQALEEEERRLVSSEFSNGLKHLKESQPHKFIKRDPKAERPIPQITLFEGSLN
ncbi:unnamed protein product [Prunus armeniaca]